MIKKYQVLFVFIILLVSCNKMSDELIGQSHSFLNRGFHENNPYGMVFIKGGSFMMGTNDQSAFNLTIDKPVNATVDAFWMDETEITNDEYKQFVYWVKDSIARRMLVMQLDDQQFGEDVKKLLSPIYKNVDFLTDSIKQFGILNWKTRIPWNSKEPEIQAILSQLYEQDINQIKLMNTGKLRFQYQWINYDQVTLNKNKYNVNTGAYPKNATVKVDTSWVDDNGIIRDSTLNRKLASRKDLISTKIVNIYPDTLMWLRDFQYAFNDPKMKMYFSHPGFANYPVVGVTWEQAKAFCQWRTQLYNSHNRVGAQEYRLPTEPEWEYAARGGRQLAMYPWGNNYLRNSKGCYLANFKPMRGSYTDDTGGTTMKVASFPPNDFGLWDMAGNVAEWTSSAYVSSSNTLVSDLNPSFEYNAKNSDPNILKRKVVKGGSWKDVGYFLQCGVKTYEYQFESRPYIGFRCVRSYNGDYKSY
jgi:formylglycine-generating enzyme